MPPVLLEFGELARGKRKKCLRVVVGVGCSSTLVGAWMIVGRGGGGTTVAEADDLETTGCDIGDFVFPSPYLN